MVNVFVLLLLFHATETQKITISSDDQLKIGLWWERTHDFCLPDEYYTSELFRRICLQFYRYLLTLFSLTVENMIILWRENFIVFCSVRYPIEWRWTTGSACSSSISDRFTSCFTRASKGGDGAFEVGVVTVTVSSVTHTDESYSSWMSII